MRHQIVETYLLYKKCSKSRAQIMIDGKTKHLISYTDEEEEIILIIHNQ